MAQIRSVTLGTDGNIDYVETPDGVRYALGTTSVLQVVAKLVSGQRHRRDALERFNKEGQAMVLLDLDAMFDMLAPKRVRWAATADLLIPEANREAPLQGGTMNPKDFVQRLAYIEQQIAVLNQGPNPQAMRNLRAAVANITLPNFGDQGKNDAFYGLGEPKVDTLEDPGAWTPPSNVTHPLGKSASFEVLQRNTKLAEEIVQVVAETDAKIDALVTAGRRFNASKAQGHLHAIVAQLTDVMSQADLAEPFVHNDLRKLASQAASIQALFAPAKV